VELLSLGGRLARSSKTLFKPPREAGLLVEMQDRTRFPLTSLTGCSLAAGTNNTWQIL